MYLLDDKKEHLRLDEQNSMEVYSVREELRNITISKDDLILDAGCGHGAITDELIEKGATNIIGVDGSEERVKNYAYKYKDNSFVKSEVSMLEDLPFEDNSFDKIFCRFVLHHMTDPTEVLNEYKRVLKKGGLLVLVDSDGILFNIYSRDYDFKEEFSALESKLDMDMMVGRKLKPYLNEMGLNNLSSKIIPMHFTGAQLSDERDQYISRFTSMEGTLIEILGKGTAKEFTKNYINALSNHSTELFYNKFVVTGVK